MAQRIAPQRVPAANPRHGREAGAGPREQRQAAPCAAAGPRPAATLLHRLTSAQRSASQLRAGALDRHGMAARRQAQALGRIAAMAASGATASDAEADVYKRLQV